MENRQADQASDTAARRSTPSKLADVIAEIQHKMPPPLTQEQWAKREQEIAEQKRLEGERQIEWKVEALMKQVGVRYQYAFLDTFECTCPDQETAVGKVRSYLNQFRQHVRHGDGLMFYGPPGTGKDHLLVAAMRHAVEQGARVHWVNGLELFGDVRDNMDTDESEADFIRRLTAPDILAISDPVPPWGALTQFQASILFRVVDHRYRDNKPIWTTVNVSGGGELSERLGEQIRDRLRDRAVCVQCNWPSYRSAGG